VVDGGGYKKNLAETMVWKGWELANRVPVIHELGNRVAGAMGNHLPNVGPLKQWTSVRTTPRLARRTLHERVRNEGVSHE
jgi:L-lactate dehydrogenase complex protein LldF